MFKTIKKLFYDCYQYEKTMHSIGLATRQGIAVQSFKRGMKPYRDRMHVLIHEAENRRLSDLSIKISQSGLYMREAAENASKAFRALGKVLSEVNLK